MFKSTHLSLLLIAFIVLMLPPFHALAAGPVIINEIMYDLKGTDSGHEWVEIKNISDQPVDLKNWRFFDGSNHLLNEPPQNGGQGSLVIPPGGYAILADKADIFLADHPGFSGIVIDTVMSLGNEGEILRLIDQNGNVVEEVSYQKGMGGNGNGYSLERTSDFSIQFCESKNLGGSPGQPNNFDCNKPTITPTPSTTKTKTPTPTPLNISPSFSPPLALIEGETEDDDDSSGAASNDSLPVMKVNVIINEFLPNPVGTDAENEWIELYNNSDIDVALKDWWLEDASGQKYVFKDEEIARHGYLILPYSKTKITLNNNGETLSLYSPQGELAFKISYSGKAKEGMSFARAGQNDWRWTSIITPNTPNQFASSDSTKKTQVAVQTMDESVAGKNAEMENNTTSVNSADADSYAGNSLATSSTPTTADKIIIIAIGLGLILSVAAAIFIKKALPPINS